MCREGYELPKPLIEVSGKPIIVQAAGHLPPAEKRIFVCLCEHLDAYPLAREIASAYPGAEIVRIDQVTEGRRAPASWGSRASTPTRRS